MTLNYHDEHAAILNIFFKNEKLQLKKIIFFVITSFCLLFPFTAQSQEKTLKVGVALGDPFVIPMNNEFSGIAIDIWKLIADEEKIKFIFVPMGEHIDDAIAKLAAGQIDILIGPIVPTYERMKLVDFMQPFYLNQIGLVVRTEQVNFFNALSSILTPSFVSALLIFLFVFILYLHVYWYYEIRPKQKTQQGYWEGVKEAFWLHTLDIDLGQLPSHVRTRQIRFFWLILLTLFFSSLTASITSALTIALSGKYVSYNSIIDFKNKKMAAVIHTAPYDIAKDLGFTILAVDERDGAIDLLLQGKIDAFVDYYPVADYYLTQHDLTHKLTMANYVIQRNTFAFALPNNSPLRRPLNLRLRLQQNYGIIKTICNKYFMGNEKSTINCEI